MRTEVICLAGLLAVAASATYITPASTSADLGSPVGRFTKATPLPARPSTTPKPAPGHPAKNAPMPVGRVNETQVVSTPPRPSLEAALSIKDVKQSMDQPVIKVLVINMGKVKNKPGEPSKLTVVLETPQIIPNNFANMGPVPAPMYFWLSGTKQPEIFQRIATVPPLGPGQSVWVDVDFTLPDPGQYVVPPDPLSAAMKIIAKGSNAAAQPIDQCRSFRAFVSSELDVKFNVYHVDADSLTGIRNEYETQLSPSALKFMKIAQPGKYKKC